MPQDVLAAAGNGLDGQFFAQLYLGLYYEATGNKALALRISEISKGGREGKRFLERMRFSRECHRSDGGAAVPFDACRSRNWVWPESALGMDEDGKAHEYGVGFWNRAHGGFQAGAEVRNVAY